MYDAAGNTINVPSSHGDVCSGTTGVFYVACKNYPLLKTRGVAGATTVNDSDSMIQLGPVRTLELSGSNPLYNWNGSRFTDTGGRWVDGNTLKVFYEDMI